MTASDAPSRRTTLFVTPLASVLAVHVSETEVGVGLEPTRFVGAVGAVRSIVQPAVAGVGSAIPPTDASTEKLCVPAARPENVVGLAHATHALPSSRQVNVAVLSVEWNVKDPEVDFVKAAGPLSITVSGGGLAAAATSAVASSNTRTRGTARSGRQEIRGRDSEGRPDIDTGNGWGRGVAVQWFFVAASGRLSLPGGALCPLVRGGTLSVCGKSHCLGCKARPRT